MCLAKATESILLPLCYPFPNTQTLTLNLQTLGFHHAAIIRVEISVECHDPAKPACIFLFNYGNFKERAMIILHRVTTWKDKDHQQHTMHCGTDTYGCWSFNV